MFENALSCSGPQSHVDFLVRSCLSGWVSSARIWENFPSWFIIPIKRRRSEIFVGSFISMMADTLSWYALIPFSSMRCPRNYNCFCLNSHLFRFSVTPDEWILCNTFINRSSCSVSSFTNIRMSSIRHNAPSRPEQIAVILFWKCSGALEISQKAIFEVVLSEGSNECCKLLRVLGQGYLPEPTIGVYFAKELGS